MDAEEYEEESAEDDGEGEDRGSLSSDEFDVEGKTDTLNLPELRDPDEDNPASSFYVNSYLPKVEKDSIDTEGKTAVKQILAVITKLEHEFHDCDVIQDSTLLTFTNKLNAHMDLKYPLSTELRKRIILFSLDIHGSPKKTSVIGRTLALRIMIILMGKSWGPISLLIDWRPFWSEMTTRMFNEDFDGRFMTTETIVVNYYKSLALFISTARRFFNTVDANVQYSNNVVDIGMQKLKNIQTPEFVEGALLLALCLPNNFAHYSELLPTWFDIWGRINQNTLWDMAWIQVMAHAVKMTDAEAFDWKPYLPFLYSKLKGLLRLPLARANFTFQTFPRIVPSYYQLPFSFIADFHHTMLLKLTKIITKVILRDTETTVPAEKSVMTLPTAVEDMLTLRALQIPGFNQVDGLTISESAAQLLQFIHSLRAFVHAAGSGEYTARIAVFINVILKTFGTHLGHALGDMLQDDNANAAKFPSPVAKCLPIVRYISGYCLTYMLDCMYVEDARVIHAFARCIEHLVPILPDSVHVLCSFFLDALQPRAFQNASHSLIALKSLGYLLRSSLFPQPIILTYLPDLLQLLLQGLEASDPDRINAILTLLYQLFSWLPLSKYTTLEIPVFTSYPSLLECTSSAELRNQLAVFVAPVKQNEYRDLVDYVTNDWFPQLLERIFVVTDAEEAPVEGAESTAITIAGQLLTILYQAIDRPDTVFVEGVATKIREYVLHRAPAHTDKTCGKIVEFFVACFPSYQNYFLSALLTQDVVRGTMTSDRLVFRLRLIGACFRRSAGQELSPEVASSFKDAFVEHYTRFSMHEEPKVRKMISKVYKDFLKSLTAVYPINQRPRVSSSDSMCLGAPNVADSTDAYSWFLPTESTMKRAVDLLRHITEGIVDDISRALVGTSSGTKSEECIGSGLAILSRLARGVASVLTFSSVESTKAPDVTVENEVFIQTGREYYISQLSDSADREYFITYQERLLNFLAEVHRGVESATTTRSSLANNVSIRKEWMQTLHAHLTQRSGVCTDCVEYRADLISMASMATCSLSIAVYKRFKASNNIQRCQSTAIGESIRFAHFWKRHDWPFYNLSEIIWAQHGLRAQFFATQETHHALLSGRNLVARECIAQLLQLTRHSYDEIHPQARVYYIALFDYFPDEMRKEVCDELVMLLYKSHPGFHALTSTLVLLMSRFIEIIHSDDLLKSRLLLSTPYVMAAASEEPDEEKREAILTTFTTLFVSYAVGWAFPLSTNGKVVAQELLLKSCLESFGAKLYDNEEEAVTGDLVQAANTGWISRGMRYDTLYGFVILHLFEPSLLKRGHISIELIRFLWYHLCHCHDQPTQYIGNSLLYVITDTLQNSSKEELDILLAQPWAYYLRLQLNPLSKKNDFRSFIVSQVKMALHSMVESNNLWSEGVDTIVGLVTGQYVNLSSNRMSRRRTGSAQFSANFSTSFATLIFTLCDVGLIPLFSSEHRPSEVIQSILVDILEDENIMEINRSHSEGGPHEARLLNDIRAEFFGGFLRLYFIRGEKFGSDYNNTGELLAGYLQMQVQQVSAEYIADWQEALIFSTEALVTVEQIQLASQSVLVQQVMRDFAAAVMMAGANMRSRLFLQQQHSVSVEQDDATIETNDIPQLLRQYSNIDTSQATVESSSAMAIDDVKESEEPNASLQQRVVGKCLDVEEDDDGDLLIYDQPFPLALSRQHSLSHVASTHHQQQKSASESSHSAATNLPTPPPLLRGTSNAAPLTRQTSVSSVDSSAVDVASRLGLKRQRSLSIRNVDVSQIASIDPIDMEQHVVAALPMQRQASIRKVATEDKVTEQEFEDVSESFSPSGEKHQVHSLDSGFLFIDKCFALLRAVLLGISTSTLFLPPEQKEHPAVWSLAHAVAQFLASPEVDLVVEYTSSRVELMAIVATLTDVCYGQTFLPPLVDEILQKLLKGAADEKRHITAKTPKDSDCRSEYKNCLIDPFKTEPPKAVTASDDSEKLAKEATKRRQYAVESLSFLTNWLWHLTNAADTARPLSLRCLPVLLEAVAAPHNETMQQAMGSLFNFALGVLQVDTASEPTAAIEQTLHVLQPYLSNTPLWHENWRVREMLLRIAIGLQSWHWHVLDNKQKQALKNIFVVGLKDPQKQVQDAALTAMPDYLALKTDTDLKLIAEAYMRNSDTLLAREKQKRKLKRQEELHQHENALSPSKSGSSSALDPGHLTTVQMLAAIVLARPYDLPSFTPAVLSSLLRHSCTNNDTIKSILQRVVQDFRTSHQDHWERDLRAKFTSEQLEDLQGAGAAHYFA